MKLVAKNAFKRAPPLGQVEIKLLEKAVQACGEHADTNIIE